MEQDKAPIITHLSDLRTSLIRALIGLLVGMIACYAVADHIMLALKNPMLAVMPQGSSFVVLSPQEYFFTKLKAALFFGFVLSSPWIFLQVWRFIAPGLYKNEKRLVVWFVISASCCFLLGVAFAYFLVFPAAFKFFVETLPFGIKGAYSISLLYGFAISVLMAFGIMFQTPIAVFLLAVFDLVSIDTLGRYRRLVLVGAFVVGALLTPPDPITQVMLALPAYALFEIGLLFTKAFLNKASLTEASQKTDPS